VPKHNRREKEIWAVELFHDELEATSMHSREDANQTMSALGFSPRTTDPMTSWLEVAKKAHKRKELDSPKYYQTSK
jgi:hypothetical protein